MMVALVAIAPREASLGSNVRLVYLHGAWVWTSLMTFAAAAGSGVLGLLGRIPKLQRWSHALGIVGTFFWVTYLPLSLWTMQANWNGLYLSEPRWRIGLDFAVAALLVQTGALLLDRLSLTSILNTLFFVTLAWSLAHTEQVMHPPSPIFSAEGSAIPAFFLGIATLCLLAALQMCRWVLLKGQRT
jgi:hypothetical protein